MKPTCSKCMLSSTVAVHSEESNRTRFFCADCASEYENQCVDAGVDYTRTELIEKKAV
jgi:ribosomal protein S27AE